MAAALVRPGGDFWPKYIIAVAAAAAAARRKYRPPAPTPGGWSEWVVEERARAHSVDALR